MAGSIESLARTAAFSAAIVLLTPTIAVGQTQMPAQTDLLGRAALASLTRGETVWVTTLDGLRRKTRVVAVSPGGLTLDSAPASVPFDQIVRLEKQPREQWKRIVKGSAIGFGSGAGGSGLLLMTCWGDECEEDLTPVFAFGAIGAGIGAGIGALLNLWNREENVIYEARPRATTLVIEPILSPTRKGVAFSMTWQ